MRNDRPVGFTLIEVLVVLLIVAIITAVAVIAFSGVAQKTRREKIVIEQFVQTITVAQQQAILAPSVLGLGLSTTGYRYYRYQSQSTGRWEPLSNALSRPDAFQEIFTVNIASMEGFHGAEVANTGMRGSVPTIIFLPSGYVTPFTLVLNGEKNNYTITVTNKRKNE